MKRLILFMLFCTGFISARGQIVSSFEEPIRPLITSSGEIGVQYQRGSYKETQGSSSGSSSLMLNSNKVGALFSAEVSFLEALIAKDDRRLRFLDYTATFLRLGYGTEGGENRSKLYLNYQALALGAQLAYALNDAPIDIGFRYYYNLQLNMQQEPRFVFPLAGVSLRYNRIWVAADFNLAQFKSKNEGISQDDNWLLRSFKLRYFTREKVYLLFQVDNYSNKWNSNPDAPFDFKAHELNNLYFSFGLGATWH